MYALSFSSENSVSGTDLIDITPYEEQYIKACSYLVPDERLLFELLHLHHDLLNSEAAHRYLSTACLKSCIKLSKKENYDKNSAIRLLEQQFTHPPSLHLLAFLRELELDYSYSFNLYNMNLIYPPSSTRLGIMYHRGTIPKEYSSGKEKDAEKALELGLDGMRKGYLHSENFLGSIYDSDKGPTSVLPEEDKKIRATEMFETAANRGCSCALFNVGLNLRQGKFPYEVIPEYEREIKAYLYFLQSSKSMNYGAMQELAEMIQAGEGPAKRWSEGKRLRESGKFYYWVKKAKWAKVEDYKFTDDQFHIIEKEGVFLQDIFDAFFCNAFVNDDNEYFIEGDGFLLYKETGFSLNFIGCLFQGNMDRMKRIAKRGIFPEYRELQIDEIPDLPESFKGKLLKIANIEIDLSDLNNQKNLESKIACCLITPR